MQIAAKRPIAPGPDRRQRAHRERRCRGTQRACTGQRAAQSWHRGHRSAFLRRRHGDGHLGCQHRLHPDQLDPGRERQARSCRGHRAHARGAQAQHEVADFPHGQSQGGRHGERRSRAALRRIHLDPRGHRQLRRGPCRDGHRTLSRAAAAAVCQGAGELQPRARVLLGRARPPGWCRLPQVARGPAVLRFLRREPVPHRHGHRARRARLLVRPQRAGG